MKRNLKLAILALIVFLLSIEVGLVSSAYISPTGFSVQSFSVDRDTVNPMESAVITVIMTNGNDYGGAVSEGFTVPSNIAGTCAVYGGEGSLYFLANEAKTVTLNIKNTGNLLKDTLATFTYHIYNENGDLIYTKDVPLMLKQGLGLPTNSPTPTSTPEPQDPNYWIPLIVASIIFVALVLSLIGFAMYSKNKNKPVTMPIID